MKVIGPGLKSALVLPSNMQKESMIINQSGFKQMLSSVRTNHGSTGGLRLTNHSAVKAEKAGLKPIADLLSFLQTTDLLQLDGGKELQSQLTANPQSDILSLVKDFLGISEQKWSEMMNNSGQDSTQMSADGNSTNEAMTTILSGLSNDLSPANLNENTILFLKSAKLFDLLSAYQGVAGKQTNLSPLLNMASEKLQEGIQNSSTNQVVRLPTRQNLLNKHSVVIQEMNRLGGKIEHSQQDSLLGTNTIQDLLSLLTVTDLQQINGWKELLSQIQVDPNANILQSVKSYLGISDQKWSEIISDLTGTVQQTQQSDSQVLSKMNMSQIQGKSQADILQSIKTELGISDQKWAEVIDQLNSSLKNKLVSSKELPEKIMSGLSKLGSAQLQSDNTLLFIKAAKLYDLLTSSNGKSTEQLSGTQFLEMVKEKLPEMIQGSQSNGKQSDFQNAFTRVINGENQTFGDASKEKLAKVDVPVWGGNTLGFHSMTKPEQLSIMLNGSQKYTSTSDIMQQFESILAKSHFSKMNGIQRLFIKLSPENLGTLSIEVIQKDHTLVAKILASTETAKDVLKSQLNGLKSSFAAQNIQVDKVEIGMQSTQSHQEQFSNRNQQNQQDQDNEQQSKKKEQNNEEANSGFTFSLEEALFNKEA